MGKAKGPAGRFARRKKTGKPGSFNPLKTFCDAISRKDAPIKNEIESQQAALWYMFFYYWIGCNVYMAIAAENYEEEWTVVDTMYFLTVTMTTAGYGDMDARGPNGEAQWFSLFWAIFGVAVVAVALVEVAGFVLDAREALEAKARAAVLKASTGSSGNDEEIDEEAAAKLAQIAAKKEAAAEGGGGGNPVSRLFNRFPILSIMGYLMSYAFFWGVVYMLIEDDWTLIDGLYFSIITGTSIGYGDISPQTQGGRGLALLFLPFAVVFVSTQLGGVSDAVFGGGGDDKLAKLLELDLSLEGLLAMDEDGDGEITEYEFIRHMLVVSGMGDKDAIDALHKRFEEMDEDGSGALTADDLKVQPLGSKEKAEPAAVRNAQGLWKADLASVPGPVVLGAVLATKESLMVGSPGELVLRKRLEERKMRLDEQTAERASPGSFKERKFATISGGSVEDVTQSPGQTRERTHHRAVSVPVAESGPIVDLGEAADAMRPHSMEGFDAVEKANATKPKGGSSPKRGSARNGAAAKGLSPKGAKGLSPKPKKLSPRAPRRSSSPARDPERYTSDGAPRERSSSSERSASDMSTAPSSTFASATTTPRVAGAGRASNKGHAPPPPQVQKAELENALLAAAAKDLH